MAISKIKMPNNTVYDIGVDWDNINDKPNIPTNISDLINDSEFLPYKYIGNDYNTLATDTGVAYGVVVNNKKGILYNLEQNKQILLCQDGILYRSKADAMTWEGIDFLDAYEDRISSAIATEQIQRNIALAGKANIADVAGKANISDIPTKTSDLTNDSGFLTQHQDISGKANNATTLSGYGITDGYNWVERTYNNINTCLGLNTIYKITDIPNGTEIPDKGILFNIQQGSNKTVQYLFTSAKRILTRELLNENWGSWQSITSSIEGELSTLTEHLSQYVINEDLDWYPSISQINYFTDSRALYKFVYPSSEVSGPRNEFVALTYFTGQSDSIQDENGNDIYPNGSQIIISQSGKMYIRKADNQGIFSTIEELKPEPEHGTITSNNKGWYTQENGVTKYLTGTYRLIDDMCILTGKAQIPYNWEELYYTLPITPTQGAATVSFDGGVHYYIGTTMRSSETITNASVMRIARVDGERFSADTTIHFVLTYPYK